MFFKTFPGLAFALSFLLASSARADFDSLPRVKEFEPRLRGTAEVILSEVANVRGSKPETSAPALARLDVGIATAKNDLKRLPRGAHDELWFLIGLGEEAKGNNDAAQGAYEESLRLRSQNPQALFLYARILLKSGKTKDALAKFQELSWSSKTDLEEIYFYISECYTVLGSQSEAEQALKKSFAKNSTFLPTLNKMVSSKSLELEKTVDPSKQRAQEAEIAALLGAVVKADPSNREASLRLANFLLKTSDPVFGKGKIEDARDLAERLVKQSKFEDPESVRLLISSEVKLGRFEQARAALDKGIAKSPTAPALLDAQQELAMQQQLLLGQSTP